MKIVIDIPDELYKEQLSSSWTGNIIIHDAIMNGTLLSKGHGRIGDLSKIYDRLNDAQIEGTVEYKGLGEAKQIICDAPTIIKADKEDINE